MPVRADPHCARKRLEIRLETNQRAAAEIPRQGNMGFEPGIGPFRIFFLRRSRCS